MAAMSQIGQGSWRRRFVRVIVPIGAVIIMLVAMATIALYGYQNNRRDALALSDEVLQSLNRRIVTEVRSYLSPASQMVTLASDIIEVRGFPGQRDLAEPFAIHVLQNNPQLSSFFFADPGGDFLMLKEMPDGAIHTKTIDRDGDTIRSSFWIRRDTEGNLIKIDESPDDPFDPRVRPWFIGAVEKGGLYWSDIYIFFTDQKPGLTASLPVYDENLELIAVIGLDIALEELSNFLSSLKIGLTGQAMIVDSAGRLVAHPNLELMLKEVNGELQPVKLNELGDPVLTRVFNRLRIEGEGGRELNVGGVRYVSAVSSLEDSVGRDWSVLIVAPEDDFVGFVAKHNRTALLLSVGVLSFAGILAGLLVYQGLRADRNAQLVLDRQEQLTTQSRAFAELASRATLFDLGDDEALKDVTKIASRAVGVRRVSIWRLVDNGTTLTCDDCYDRESDGHTQGSELAEYHFPQVFQIIRDGEAFAIDDTENDPRTAELFRIYLGPLGCRSLQSLAILHRGEVVGVIWFEDEGGKRTQAAEETAAFGRAIANMLALRLAATHSKAPFHDHETDRAIERSSRATQTSIDLEESNRLRRASSKRAAYTPREDMRTATIADSRSAVFRQRLASNGRDGATLGADIYDDASVLVLTVPDATSLAERLEDADAANAGDHLVRRLEDLANEYEIEYVKVMGDQMVCATGLNGDGDDAHRVGDLALRIQEECLRLFTDLDDRMVFRLGIDTGPVIGSPLGKGGKTYNLWGQAVHAAVLMAQTGESGRIQVTESTYRRLRDHYVFRVRGRYYLEGVGELSTYILAGRMT